MESLAVARLTAAAAEGLTASLHYEVPPPPRIWSSGKSQKWLTPRLYGRTKYLVIVLLLLLHFQLNCPDVLPASSNRVASIFWLGCSWMLDVPFIVHLHSEVTDSTHEYAGTHVVQPRLHNVQLDEDHVLWLLAWIFTDAHCTRTQSVHKFIHINTICNYLPQCSPLTHNNVPSPVGQRT